MILKGGGIHIPMPSMGRTPYLPPFVVDFCLVI